MLPPERVTKVRFKEEEYGNLEEILLQEMKGICVENTMETLWNGMRWIIKLT